MQIGDINDADKRAIEAQVAGRGQSLRERADPGVRPACRG